MREVDRNQQEYEDLKEDAFSERWRLAEDALNIAREVQRESGKLMSGRICLDDLTERRIERFLKQTLFTVTSLKETQRSRSHREIFSNASKSLYAEERFSFECRKETSTGYWFLTSMPRAKR